MIYFYILKQESLRKNTRKSSHQLLYKSKFGSVSKMSQVYNSNCETQ